MPVFAVPHKKKEETDDRTFITGLYTRYSRLMYATALHYISDSHDCEDVVQDAVESLCENAKKLRELPEYALPAYICSTVKHTAANFLRRQAMMNRHITELDSSGYEDYESPGLSLEEIWELNELKAGFSQAWLKLPEEDQELLRRKYVFEQTNEELAELFHCKKDSIRMRLTRTRRKILSLMEGADGDVQA